MNDEQRLKFKFGIIRQRFFLSFKEIFNKNTSSSNDFQREGQLDGRFSMLAVMRRIRLVNGNLLMTLFFNFRSKCSSHQGPKQEEAKIGLTLQSLYSHDERPT